MHDKCKLMQATTKPTEKMAMFNANVQINMHIEYKALREKKHFGFFQNVFSLPNENAEFF